MNNNNVFRFASYSLSLSLSREEWFLFQRAFLYVFNEVECVR